MTAMTGFDFALEPDLDRVAGVAFGIAEKLREEDLDILHREVVDLCHRYPAKASQIIFCLAAWFDPDTPTRSLWERVEAITRSRVEAVLRRAA